MSAYLDILRRYWHYDNFRPLQAEIIESIGSGNDTLALLPTGGGKSLCFQVPALAMLPNDDADGLCIVITPLIALMKDQVQHLRRLGIKSFALYAGQTPQETSDILDHCQFGRTRFLYVSPERLESERFKQRLRFLPVTMIAVDEAHCISEWGYDFRPPYLRISSIRDTFPDVPVIALTATATPEVVEDIKDKLKRSSKASASSTHEGNKKNGWSVFRSSFCRDNLVYVTREAEQKELQLLHILQSVHGSAIVYVRSRQKTRLISELLTSQGISSSWYHAGLNRQERDQRQQAWMNDETRVIVATNAFGMGIDKPDVRLVVHLDIPDSIEAYFQEAGRGGRDGQTAYAVLLYNKRDEITIKKRESDTFPDLPFVKRVYEAVGDWLEIALGCGAGHSYTLPFDTLCHDKHLPLVQTHSAIAIIAQSGFWSYEEEHETPPRVQIRCTKEQLYKEELSERQEHILQYMMRRYTGMFTTFAYIDIDNISESLGIRVRDINAELIELAKNGIITYIPHSIAPMVTYLLDRQPLEKLNRIEDGYLEKKRLYSNRQSAVYEYATQKDFCRQQLLVSYFGELDAAPCGQCDVCRRRKAEENRG